MSLGAFALIASEFMPVSLLTPIAADLGVTEGQAGQAISISGAFAVFTALFISALSGRLNRKALLLILTALMAVSGSIAALAPSYEVFMIGRAFIGIVIGGFWSMSAATAMRLVPQHQVPQALAVVNGGLALATVVAPPLGSFLGSLIGWRGAFLLIVPVAVIVFVWQWVSLPSMKVVSRRSATAAFRVLVRPVVALGMAAVGVLHVGWYSLYTYVRPFLEVVTRVEVATLSLILLMMGATGVLGTLWIGRFINKNLYRTLIAAPVLMGLIAAALILFGSSVALTVVLLGVWGLLATSSPVGWWTWIARTLPNEAEAGGGLMVAVAQLAIASGAGFGGLLYDASGYQATFALSASALFVAALLAVLTSRSTQTATTNA